MTEFEHELRLLWAIAINGALGFAAHRAARSLGEGDRVQRWLDTLLLWWTGQYAVVGLLGVVGFLTPFWMSAGACILAVGTAAVFRRSTVIQPLSGRESIAVLGGLVFVISFIAALLWNLRVLPPMSDDPLTYHLSAAASWLQNHRIAVYETWFFNPANTYSPLGGSMFAAWLIAPFGNDVAARFVQAPAIAAIYLAGVQLSRRLGSTVVVASMLGVAGALCAPVVRQAGLAKDDLFLTAFALTCINAVGRSDRLGGWRGGLALGLAASIKVTCVYTLAPMLLLMLPILRSSWRKVVTVLGCAAAVAGPWYLRNWIAFGNPLFPAEVRVFGKALFPGLFVTTNSPRLRETAGLNEIFITGYFSLGFTLAVLVVVLLLGALIFSFRRLPRDRTARVCLLGPILGTAAFVLTSPYGEVRFLYPWILTSMFCVALWPRKMMAAAAVVTVVAAIGTSFASDLVKELLPVAAGATAIGLGVGWASSRSMRLRWVATSISIAAAGGAVWVNWRSYVSSLPEYADQAWEGKYDDLGKAWTFLRTNTDTQSPVAYTGTYLTYPMMGSNLQRRVFHVPVSTSVTDLSKLPRFEQPLSARNMLREVIPAAERDSDREVWVSRLRQSGARYLLIQLRPPANAPQPVEWRWATRDTRFRRLFAAGSVFVLGINLDSPADNPRPRP